MEPTNHPLKKCKSYANYVPCYSSGVCIYRDIPSLKLTASLPLKIGGIPKGKSSNKKVSGCFCRDSCLDFIMLKVMGSHGMTLGER